MCRAFAWLFTFLVQARAPKHTTKCRQRQKKKKREEKRPTREGKYIKLTRAQTRIQFECFTHARFVPRSFLFICNEAAAACCFILLVVLSDFIWSLFFFFALLCIAIAHLVRDSIATQKCCWRKCAALARYSLSLRSLSSSDMNVGKIVVSETHWQETKNNKQIKEMPFLMLRGLVRTVYTVHVYSPYHVQRIYT